MNGTSNLARTVGYVFGSVVVVALTGCPTFGERPQYGGAYYGSTGQAGASYAEIRIESDFYEPLSPYGRWEVVGSYGRCWIPGGVDADWSPYSNGYWQSTDAGWYWASDEPWGWATYHYGRWDLSLQFGWYWVPQTQWAPAWVSWRQGGGYVGWAPLSPSGRGVVEVNRRGGTPGGYVFVEERRFLDPVRPQTIIVNNTIISRAVINETPRTAVIEQASGRKLQAVPVRQLRSKEEAKVVARRPAPTSTHEQAVPMPVRSPAEKAPPARESRQVEPKAVPAPAHNQAENARPTPEPRQVERPAVTAPPQQQPATKNEVHPADGQSRAAKLDEEKRVQQDKAQAIESTKRQPIPAAVEAKPEAQPQVKHETQQAQPQVKHETEQAQPQAKHETQQAQSQAKHEPQQAAERPAATKEPSEQKAGKDDDKKD